MWVGLEGKGEEPAHTAQEQVVASMNWMRQTKSRTSWGGFFFPVSVFIFTRVLAKVHHHLITSRLVKCSLKCLLDICMEISDS